MTTTAVVRRWKWIRPSDKPHAAGGFDSSRFPRISSPPAAFRRKTLAAGEKTGYIGNDFSTPRKSVVMHPVVLKQVGKTYHLDAVDVPALADINLDIRPNCFTVLSGPSGSGKTTLLNIIGCIDKPDSGQITVAGQDVLKMSDDALSDFRARHLGFIFQNFNLLPVLTAYENVEYPLVLAGVPAGKRRERVLALLDAVGLADRAGNRPGQLSGGQRQRVAIARALAPAPKLVLADEPTANLDSHTGAAIIDLMRKMQREHNVSFVFSSHDPQVLAEADDAVFIRDGRITGVERKQEVAA
jgi:putative ABC transport system ATP-binding protein